MVTVGASSDGQRLIVGGAFSHVNGIYNRWSALINGTTGSLDPVQLSPVEGPLSAIVVSPDDAFISVSMTGAGNSGNRYRLADGHRLFRQVCDGDGQAVEDIAGTVYSGFHEACRGDTSIRLTANDATTGVRDLTYQPSFDRFWGVRSIDATSTALAVAGDFTSISGVPAQGFAILPSNGTPLPPTTTTTSTTTTTTAPPPSTVDFPNGLGSSWRYHDGADFPTAEWATAGYDDQSWPRGPGQLGYGDGDEATVLSYGPNAGAKTPAAYFRKTVTMGAMPSYLGLDLVADDGAIVYLNGVEVLRANLPAGPITPTTYAATNRSGAGESLPRAFTVSASLLHPGTNVIAVEVHQDAPNSSDLSFDLAARPA